MSKYIIDIHYPCGHVEYKQFSYQHMRGVRYNNQRPCKIVCHFMPGAEFLFKTCQYVMHPIKREGVFVLVDGEEVNAIDNYHELQMLQLMEVIQ